MAIKLTTKAQWHEFEPGVKLLLNPITRKDYRKLINEANGDDEQLISLLADKAIADWEGIVGEDDTKLPVTAENKKAVHDIMYAFVDSHCRGYVHIDEADLKN